VTLGIDAEHGDAVLEENGRRMSEVLPWLPVDNHLAVELVGQIDPDERGRSIDLGAA
jgi:hypothetical protein